MRLFRTRPRKPSASTRPRPLRSWVGEDGGVVHAPSSQDEYWLSQTARLLAPASERDQFCHSPTEFGVCGIRLRNGACPRRH